MIIKINFLFVIYNGLINSKRIHPPSPGHLLGSFSLRLLPHGGVFAKESQPGGGALSKTTQSFGSINGSTPTCANTCTTASTCKQKMKKRRTCTVREKS